MNSRKGWHAIAGIKASVPPLSGFPKLPSVSIIGSYRFNPIVSVGVGTEVGVVYIRKYEFSMPIFANLKTNFTKRSVSPYFSFDLGWRYSGNFRSDMKENFREIPTGLMFRPGLGIEFNVGQKYMMLVGLESEFVYGKAQNQHGVYNQMCYSFLDFNIAFEF